MQIEKNESRKTVAKSPTGIKSLDHITGGGLPQGRPTLVSGNAGCGKTLLGVEFLVRGAIKVKSKEGAGSTFTMSLPVIKQEEPL